MKEMNRGFSARIQGEWRERSLDNGGKRVYSAKHGPRLDPRSLVDVVPKQGASVSVLESSHAFQPQPTVSRDEVTKEGLAELAEVGLGIRDNKLVALGTRTFFPTYTITFVRHAESDMNKEKKTQGRRGLMNGREPAIAEESYAEIRTVRKERKAELDDFTHVYSSPQLRALQTAKQLFSQPIQLDERVSEVFMGGIEGVRRDLQNPEHLKLYDIEGDVTHHIGETGQSAYSKLLDSVRFLKDLEKKHGGQNANIAVVTHSNTLSLYLAATGKGRLMDGVSNFSLRNRTTPNLGFERVEPTKPYAPIFMKDILVGMG